MSKESAEFPAITITSFPDDVYKIVFQVKGTKEEDLRCRLYNENDELISEIEYESRPLFKIFKGTDILKTVDRR